MPKPETIKENKILSKFQIQTDPLIPARGQYIVLINKKICYLMDYVVLAKI